MCQLLLARLRYGVVSSIERTYLDVVLQHVFTEVLSLGLLMVIDRRVELRTTNWGAAS